jgi:hypothetical protein
MEKKPADLQKILDDLNNMGDELDDLQRRMTRHLAMRTTLLEKIVDLAKSNGNGTVPEKKKGIRIRRRG